MVAYGRQELHWEVNDTSHGVWLLLCKAGRLGVIDEEREVWHGSMLRETRSANGKPGLAAWRTKNGFSSLSRRDNRAKHSPRSTLDAISLFAHRLLAGSRNSVSVRLPMLRDLGR